MKEDTYEIIMYLSSVAVNYTEITDSIGRSSLKGIA